MITRLIIGGAQENTVLSCRGLAERGHDVFLAAGPETGPEGSLWPDARRCGCEIVTLHHLRRAVHPWRDLRAGLELLALFRRMRPDVVHTHSSKAGIVGRWAAHRAGVPNVVHTIHGMSFNRTQPRWVQAGYRLLERRAAAWTHAIVSVADAMTSQAVQAGIAPPARFSTIRSGMDTSRFRPDDAVRRRVRAAWGVHRDHIVVGTVARLFTHKGYEDILEAMPAMVAGSTGLRFVWVGDGPCREAYTRRLTALGLRDRVTLTGLLHPGEVAAEMAGFDIVLHASRWEGLPRAIVQGLLTAIPAVSYDSDGAAEVVIPAETGSLVPLGDTAALAEAVIRLSRDPALRLRLGREGRTRCLRMFDWRTMVDELDRLYRSLVTGSARMA